jgi:hypothetical protein
MTNRYLGVDPMLTNVAIGYQNDEYVAERILPYFDVKKQSGKHFVYDRGRFRTVDTLRGTGAGANEVTHKLTVGDPYYCDDHALREFVADEDIDNAITPTSPLVDATENIVDLLKIDYEIEAATLMADTGVLTQNTTLSGTSQWSDYTNSNPFTNIETAKATIHENLFVQPNTLLMGKQVFDKLKHHPLILERIKYSQMAVTTEQIMATVFGVKNVIVAGAGKNTAKEGQADDMGYIWGKHAWLLYIAPVLRPKMITFAFSYRWVEGKSPMVVEREAGVDERNRRGQYVRVGDFYYDQKLVSAEAAYLIKNAVA